MYVIKREANTFRTPPSYVVDGDRKNAADAFNYTTDINEAQTFRTSKDALSFIQQRVMNNAKKRGCIWCSSLSLVRVEESGLREIETL